MIELKIRKSIVSAIKGRGYYLVCYPESWVLGRELIKKRFFRAQATSASEGLEYLSSSGHNSILLMLFQQGCVGVPVALLEVEFFGIGQKASLYLLFVEASHRNQGLASLLMATAIDISRRNFTNCIRTSDKSDLSGFYEKFGFVKDEQTYDEFNLFLRPDHGKRFFASNRFLVSFLGLYEEGEALIDLSPDATVFH